MRERQAGERFRLTASRVRPRTTRPFEATACPSHKAIASCEIPGPGVLRFRTYRAAFRGICDALLRPGCTYTCATLASCAARSRRISPIIPPTYDRNKCLHTKHLVVTLSTIPTARIPSHFRRYEELRRAGHFKVLHLKTRGRGMRKTCIWLVLLMVPMASAASGPQGTPDLPVFERRGVVIDFKDLKYNPVDDVIFPSVINAKELFEKPLGTYYMYYAPHNAPGGICLAYADSLEGPWNEYGQNPLISRHWEPHYRVSHVSSPHALWMEEEKKLFLWFHGENSTTRYASSADGVQFTYEGVAVSTKQFEDITECSYARVFKHAIPDLGNRYVILLMGNNRGNRRIYLGWSKDGRQWETRRQPLIPALPRSSSGNVVSPWLFPWHENLYVICHSRFEHLGDVRSICAVKIDPRFQEIYCVEHLFTALKDEPENGRAASPCFIVEGDKLYMFYQCGERLRSRIALAVAPIRSPVGAEQRAEGDAVSRAP
jgi:hypothetical protein